jgi:DNA-directed RNA polymerase specialized sigma24 family protein
MMEVMELDLVVKQAILGARSAGLQAANAEDAAQDTALAILKGKEVKNPSHYGRLLGLNSVMACRRKANTEVALSVVEGTEGFTVGSCSDTDPSIWMDVRSLCTVFEADCIERRFRAKLTLEEIAESYKVSTRMISRTIKSALEKLRDGMEE